MTTIPTIAQLASNIQSNIETEFGISIPAFGKNFLRVFCLVMAAVLKLFYLSLGKVQKNIFVDTADPESSGGTLERFGRIKLGRNPFPAQAGEYYAQVTGSIGAVIPSGQTFKSNDDSLNPGKLFVLDVEYELVSTTDSILLRALEAGSDSKLLVNDQVTATSPIANVNRIAVIESESTAPFDAEDIEDYRRKALDAYRLEPNGGAASDYRIWAADAQGVEQVYPYAKTGAANEINLYVEATIADSTDGKGTPSSTLLEDVEAVVELDPDVTKPINERGRRPLGIFEIHYLAVTIREIDIEIEDFEGLTLPIETAIYNAIKEQIDSIRPFIAGADVLESKNDILNTNLIISTILTVRPGSTFGAINLLIDGTPYTSFTFTNGDIPYLDEITYP
jgi:uncharacterized phage protein gp47/JayE